MALVKIEKQTAETLAADAIREYILSGQIAPGSRLTEAFLAERFGLSRATVRGALQRMSQEGLVRLEPYTGWETISITSHDAWELYTLRASMESLAASLACANLDDAGRRALRTAYEALLDACKAQDNRAVSRADFNLHRTIIELSGHERLAQWYRVVEQQITLYITWSDFIPRNVYETVPKHHGPIVDAILAGDAGTAARLSSEHNVAAGEKLVSHLKRLEASERKPESAPLRTARALGA
ncbi:GntR family transcriptional regulator [Chitinasiproducens palmae]|uniref:DNA-binding transcriptional regulator, GntR family n=1 Tax=Chitinasiproducens palmae TaxID=1770053 RepID=A0A1H2PPP5_9BURK|nr:GntR family transcriptional regulator [Chitinasiproducens palmae]SDV48765.1 DNA-binding transcriptional regulator, GntR family [Chitinasiproducens palmae]